MFKFTTKLLQYFPKYSPIRTSRIVPHLLIMSNNVSRWTQQNYYKVGPKTLAFNVWALSVLTWLGFTSQDENKDSELIMTLKRAVLCTKREQYKKAEQLLHIALRLAQQQQNEQGIVYCYDLMANLAFEQQDFEKAEKLFVSVLQILFKQGVKQEDLRIVHISLKLARMSQLKADNEKAEIGYKWCLDKIAKQKDDSLDSQILYGVIQDWYAQFLLDNGDVPGALIHLKEAYKACLKTMGAHNEKSMLLLNDLGITSFRAGDVNNAEHYLIQGIEIGRQVEDQTHVGVLHANLGLVLLHRGIVGEAEKYCKEAWHEGKKNDNNETMAQANYCFDQIKLNLEK